MGQKSQVSFLASNLSSTSDGYLFAGGRAAIHLISAASATLTVEVAFNTNGTYVPITDITGDAVSTTTTGFFNVELPNDCLVRMNVTSGTATSATLHIAQTHSLV